MDVTTAAFEREVIEASKKLPVVVDFWAPWCAPCRALTPLIEKVAAGFAGRIKLVKINSDENPELAAAYGVRSIPNVIAFKDGRAEALFAERKIDEAERALAAVEADPALDARIEALRYRIAIVRAGAEGPGEDALAAKLAADPNDHEARLALAGLYAAQGRYREAMQALLEILRPEKTSRDGEARKQLVALFDLAAGEPELVAEYRRKLASALH